MEEKDIAEITDEETVETFEFTDEDGQVHCFVVESRFKVGRDDYVALLEVDPAVFDEDGSCDCGCGHEHIHGRSATEEDGYDHGFSGEDEEEEVNIILAKVIVDENGDIDIQVPTDEEFEKARAVYEALDE